MLKVLIWGEGGGLRISTLCINRKMLTIVNGPNYENCKFVSNCQILTHGVNTHCFGSLPLTKSPRWSSGYDAALSPSQPGFDSPSRNYAFFFSVNTRTICFLVTFHSASVAF